MITQHKRAIVLCCLHDWLLQHMAHTTKPRQHSCNSDLRLHPTIQSTYDGTLLHNANFLHSTTPKRRLQQRMHQHLHSTSVQQHTHTHTTFSHTHTTFTQQSLCSRLWLQAPPCPLRHVGLGQCRHFKVHTGEQGVCATPHTPSPRTLQNYTHNMHRKICNLHHKGVSDSTLGSCPFLLASQAPHSTKQVYELA